MKFWVALILMAVLILGITPAYAQEEAWISVDSSAPVADKIVILGYHHLDLQSKGTYKNNSSILPVEEFSRHMKYLADNNYYTLSLDELRGYLNGTFNPPAKSVLITFDDGYASNYQYAFPILTKYQQKAVIFVLGQFPDDSTAAVNPTGEVVSYLPHLSNYAISVMIRSGLIEIGSHTYNNHKFLDNKSVLTTLSSEEVKSDFKRLEETLTALNIPKPTSIAYPYGAYNDNIISASKQMGYTLGFTVDSGYVHKGDSPMTLNRFSIRMQESAQFETIVSGKWVK